MTPKCRRNKYFEPLLATRRWVLYPFFLLLITVFLSAPTKSKREVELYDKSTEEILKSYSFVGDFEQKPPTREFATEDIFWRYPFTIPDAKFELDYDYHNELSGPGSEQNISARREKMQSEFPSTTGSGLAIEHMNRGRIAFLEGKAAEAKEIWLSGRARFGTEYEFHRRNDYFIGHSFLQLALLDKDERQRKMSMDNASTFLSWAFIVKKELKDPLLDQVAPKAIYNLAAIYYNYESYAAAYGAAREGLNFLRKTGRSEYATELRRIMAESFIKTRSYLEAVQELDIALRQPTKKTETAAIFGRVADIYLDLNNFELAEEVYGFANRVYAEIDSINPLYFVFRGESLFWLGRFEEAETMFQYALNSVGYRKNIVDLPTDLAALASIRIADTWLARGKFEETNKAKDLYEAAVKERDGSPEREATYLKSKKRYEELSLPFLTARLQYFKHITEFDRVKGVDTVDYAKIRLACLELPEYQGNNIKHARTLLHEIRVTETGEDEEKKPIVKDRKKGTNEENKIIAADFDRIPLAQESLHIAWACEVGSYAQHERTKAMVERIRKFAGRYPNSRFLNSFIEPVRQVQQRGFAEYTKAGDIYSAIDFFEKTRKSLFPVIPAEMKRQLFQMYTEVYKSDKAQEFYEAFNERAKTDGELIILAMFLSEMGDLQKGKIWQQRADKLASSLKERNWTIAKSGKTSLYLRRVLDSKDGINQYQWIVNLAKTWAKKEKREYTSVCELLHPVLSRSWNESATRKSLNADYIKGQGIELIDTYLNEVLQFETFCGYSLLQFELELFADAPDKLVPRLLARKYLLINEVTAKLFWQVAEDLKSAGNLTLAAEMWKLLVSRGHENIPEVRYAKVRLDSRKTELEKLWGQ